MRTRSRLLALVTSITVVLGCAGTAEKPLIADTPENREIQAQRYLEASPPSEMWDDMVANMAAMMPENERQAFKDVLNRSIDMPRLEQIMLQAAVRHFTAAELQALADFYGSPLGKSAMSKFGEYMADVGPLVQQEVMRAVQQGHEDAQ